MAFDEAKHRETVRALWSQINEAIKMQDGAMALAALAAMKKAGAIFSIGKAVSHPLMIPSETSRVVEAKYPGWCAECRTLFEAGDRIVLQAGGRPMCAACGGVEDA